MAVLTFDQIHQIVSAHAEAEAARNAPAARACQALETLRDALVEMSPAAQSEILDEMYELMADVADTTWWRAPVALAVREG